MNNNDPNINLESLTDDAPQPNLLSKFRKQAKDFLIDTSANFAYWQPVLAAWEFTVLKYPINDLIAARTGNIALVLFLSRPFGKSIDFVRKKLIPGYETALEKLNEYESLGVDNLTVDDNREYETLVSKIRGPDKFFDMFKPFHLKHTLVRAGVDTITTSVFWNAAILPWLKYSKNILEAVGLAEHANKIGLQGTEFSTEQLVTAAIGYTALYAIAGAPYGKFLDVFRGLFNRK